MTRALPLPLALLFLAPWTTIAEEPVSWHDARTLTLEGRAWDEPALKSPFDRLPAKAEGVVRPPVWGNSRDSAGIAVRFVTDAKDIHARWTLTKDRLAMTHMPATGVSGVDLYARDGDGVWRWAAVGQPTGKSNSMALVNGLDPGRREYLLYFPLYNGVSALEIGVPAGAEIAPGPPREPGLAKPMVFYGTSIVHGGCASRPGMVHTAILGRRLDRPVVNLGFSGSGTMDPSMADLLVEIDAALYVIDCLPNMTADMVAERTAPLVRTIRETRPDVPILLAEDRTYTDARFAESQRQRNDTSRAALRKAYQGLVDEGVSGLYYLEGDVQLGPDDEGTVDGSHPTDLGFVHMADAFEPVVREALGGTKP
jgi:lysophospholipase L1-like esterase